MHQANLKKLKKIVINVGLGKFRKDEKAIESIKNDLALITGQQPVPRRAKKSIAGFGIRKGDLVGLKVTLRGAKMRDFFERLVRIVLPRTKDFQGIRPDSIDPNGNLTIGFVEQLPFPEIHEGSTNVIFGLETSIVTTVQNQTEALKLFRELGIPFIRQS